MKKNIPIIIGISLPIIMVLIIFALTVIPELSFKPQYDFIFTNQSYNNYDDRYQNAYSVVDDSIVKNTVVEPAGCINGYGTNCPGYTPKTTNTSQAPKIYLYEVVTKNTREISFEEASKLKLDSGPSSPDGYSVDFRYRSDYNIASEIFGGSRQKFNAYILKEGKAHGIYLPGVDNYYYNNSNNNFIGWIIK